MEEYLSFNIFLVSLYIPALNNLDQKIDYKMLLVEKKSLRFYMRGLEAVSQSVRPSESI